MWDDELSVEDHTLVTCHCAGRKLKVRGAALSWLIACLVLMNLHSSAAYKFGMVLFIHAPAFQEVEAPESIAQDQSLLL